MYPQNQSIFNRVMDPVCTLLDQLHSVVLSLDENMYSQIRSEVFSSSIGSHVRHILDHIRILMESVESTLPVSYDERERSPVLETNRILAAENIQMLKESLLSLTADYADVLEVKIMLSPGETLSFVSTCGREIAFLLSHTVHHNAIIAGIMKENGLRVPEYFGYAPSTISYISSRL